MKNLHEVMKVIRAKNNNQIDYRTTIGKVCKTYSKNMCLTQVIDLVINDDIELSVDDRILKEEESRRVQNAGKEVKKEQDEEGRARDARKNSSLSRADRLAISRKSARTRRKSKSDVDKAVKRRNKSNDKRERLNLD